MVALAGGATFAVAHVIIEYALHISPSYRRPAAESLGRGLAGASGARLLDAEVRGADGAVLRAWLLEPARPVARAVILLHGVADTRKGVAGPAQMFAAEGYAALMPDARGHGVSGGDPISYGLREGGDVVAWARWLQARYPGVRLYGVGNSMGGAIVLQSLRDGAPFRAVVAECAFTSFRSIIEDRLQDQLRMHGPAVRAAAMPVLGSAMLLARLRYGLNLYDASAEKAVRHSRVPILLIHGTADDVVPVEHGRRLRAANPAAVTLWEVPGAGHTGAGAAAEYRQRVLGWFATH